MPADPVTAARRTRPDSGNPSLLRSRPMLLGAVTVLFLIVMFTASMQGLPSFHPPFIEVDLPDRTAGPEPTPPTTPPTPPPEPETSFWGIIVLVLLLALVAGAAALLITMAVRALIQQWRDRPLSRRDGADVDVAEATAAGVAAAPDAPIVRRGIAAARVVVRERADPGDAIVAAWVGLEETAADAGIPRAASETPAEFTLRILLRRPGIEEATRDLLRLYESVRFGGRVGTEQDRTAAAHALDVIEEGWR